MYPYSVSNETITVVIGGKTHAVAKGHANFDRLREALLRGDWAAVPGLATIAAVVKTWSRGDFTVEGSQVRYKGEPIPLDLNQRILSSVTAGDEPEALTRFWERLQGNPSRRSVQQLYTFLKHQGIPICEDGTFLAYKSVKADFKDKYTSTLDNSPGNIHEMPRNKISDDPRVECHFGFHVGSEMYACTIFRGVGDKAVICRVAPEDVVCVPYDHQMQKVRVCRYEVVGFYAGKMPDTTIKTEELGVEPSPPKPEPKEHVSSKAPKKKQAPADESLWEGFDRMNAEALLEQGIVQLRHYAGRYCKVVGAYKLPGGKDALVSAILDTRK